MFYIKRKGPIYRSFCDLFLRELIFPTIWNLIFLLYRNKKQEKERSLEEL